MLETGVPTGLAQAGTELPAASPQTGVPTGCKGESANSCSFPKLHLTFN